MPFVFIFLTLFLGSCAADKTATTATTTTTTNLFPAATIVSDGETTDWAAVTSYYTDETSDQTTGSDANQDITAVYFAEDVTYIYARIDVSGTITMPHTAAADFSHINVNIQPYNGVCATATKITGLLIAHLYASSTTSASVLDEYSDGPTLPITGTSNIVSAAAGSVLELAIPKAKFFATTTHLMMTVDITSFVGTASTSYDSLDPNICFTLTP